MQATELADFEAWLERRLQPRYLGRVMSRPPLALADVHPVTESASSDADGDPLHLDDLQEAVDRWIRANDDYWDRFQILARLTEELGEVSSALQRIAGLRPRKVEVDLEGEVGDLLFTLAAFANVNHLNLAHAVRKTFAKYDVRDSHAWQESKIAQ
jgi:NTP pyrophosphatase (non-canonical NTP hydrolase)